MSTFYHRVIAMLFSGQKSALLLEVVHLPLLDWQETCLWRLWSCGAYEEVLEVPSEDIGYIYFYTCSISASVVLAGEKWRSTMQGNWGLQCSPGAGSITSEINGNDDEGIIGMNDGAALNNNVFWWCSTVYKDHFCGCYNNVSIW